MTGTEIPLLSICGIQILTYTVFDCPIFNALKRHTDLHDCSGDAVRPS